jgi:tryptophanyl-tRNA synthetase
MITPLGWLERVPSYKEQQENLTGKDLHLRLPWLSAAAGRGHSALSGRQFVPVGQDQVAHVELTREVARRFNHFYKLEGQRSAAGAEGAADPLAEAAGNRRPQDVQELRQHHPADRSGAGGAAEAEDHGHRSGAHAAHRSRRSDKCPVGDLHKVFSTPETLAKVYEGCRTAGIGCIQCKGWAADALVKVLAPIQERRAAFTDAQVIGDSRGRVDRAELAPSRRWSRCGPRCNWAEHAMTLPRFAVIQSLQEIPAAEIDEALTEAE